MKKLYSFILFLITMYSLPAQGQQAGELWGVTYFGGHDGLGVVFKTAPDGTNMTLAHQFSTTTSGGYPFSGLTEASDGKLYGTTVQAGLYNRGVLFSYDPATHVYSRLLDFDGPINGQFPQGNLVRAANGKLYGMTISGGAIGQGVLFDYDPASQTFTKDMDFDGSGTGGLPFGSLMEASNGKLFGMTFLGGDNSSGVVFDFDPASNTFNNDLSFDGASNGGNPKGGLVEASDGKLYGMTSAGGVNGVGVIFDLDPSSNAYHKDLDFDGSTTGTSPYGSLIQATSGKLYGMTFMGGINNQGVVFEFDPSSSAYATKLDFDLSTNGGYPNGDLLQASNGKLYGMVEFGGSAASLGSFFEFDPSSDSYAKVFDFNGPGNGSDPNGTLIQTSSGKLYGVTYQGGTNDQGVIFNYDLTTSTYTKEMDFDYAPDGSGPYSGMVQASNGKLYGMTYVGGTHAAGVIFKIDPASNTFTKVMDFEKGVTGTYPQGKLMLASNGKLYGLTSGDGANGAGVIFQFDPASNTYVSEFDFVSATGGYPLGNLIQATNGKLYGLTEQGGANNSGVIFEYELVSRIYTKKIDLDGSLGGAYPYGSLVQAANGKLYGMTGYGGTNGQGVLFEYDLLSDTYTKKYDFDGLTGANPLGSLVAASNGKLYGMTSNGGTNGGVLFEFDPVSGTYAADLDLGGYPDGSLTAGTNGKLYGVTTVDGANLLGKLFEFDPSNNSFTSKFEFTGVNGAKDSYGQLLVLRDIQTITFTQAAKTYGDASFPLTATATSGLPITYTSSDPTVAQIIGNMVTILKGGTTIITASQNGNAGYLPASNVQQTLIVNKADQTITFADNLISKTVGDPPFDLSASASSGLDISFSSSSSAVTIAGNLVTIIHAGRDTISSRQPGNDFFNSATPISRSFCINPAKPTITVSGAGTATPTLTSSALSGNQWFLNDAAIPGATGSSLDITTGGIYKVQVKVDDCASALSDNFNIAVTGLLSPTEPLSLHPNPSHDFLIIKGIIGTVGYSTVIDVLGQSTPIRLENQQGWLKGDISNLTAGLYFIKVSEGNVVHQIKFIKQ